MGSSIVDIANAVTQAVTPPQTSKKKSAAGAWVTHPQNDTYAPRHVTSDQHQVAEQQTFWKSVRAAQKPAPPAAPAAARETELERQAREAGIKDIHTTLRNAHRMLGQERRGRSESDAAPGQAEASTVGDRSELPPQYRRALDLEARSKTSEAQRARQRAQLRQTAETQNQNGIHDESFSQYATHGLRSATSNGWYNLATAGVPATLIAAGDHYAAGNDGKALLTVATLPAAVLASRFPAGRVGLAAIGLGTAANQLHKGEYSNAAASATGAVLLPWLMGKAGAPSVSSREPLGTPIRMSGPRVPVEGAPPTPRPFGSPLRMTRSGATGAVQGEPLGPPLRMSAPNRVVKLPAPALKSVEWKMYHADGGHAGVIDVQGGYARAQAQNVARVSGQSGLTQQGRIAVPGTTRAPNSSQLMYVVDDRGNLIVARRGAPPQSDVTPPRSAAASRGEADGSLPRGEGATRPVRSPHPSLVGGNHPRVRTAGMIEFDGKGRILRVSNASGHYKPDGSSLQWAREAFNKLPSSAFSPEFKGYVDHEGKVILEP